MKGLHSRERSGRSALNVVLEAAEDHGCGVVPGRSGWMVNCPGPRHARGDVRPSLSVTEGDGGVALLRCHAGCETEAVVKALDLTMRDLMPSGGTTPRRTPGSRTAEPLPSADELAKWHQRLDELDDERLRAVAGFGVETLRRLGCGWDGERVTLPVRDGSGEVATVERWAPFLATGPRLLAWPGARRDLFPAPEGIGDNEIILAESVSDVFALMEAGLQNVTCAPGAGGFNEAWAPRFRGRVVDIVFDPDSAGRKGAEETARALLPHAAEVRVLDLAPDVDRGQDARDLLRAIGPARLRARIDELIACTPPVPRVDVAQALGDVLAFVTDYVRLPSLDAADAIALWVVHTHALDAADVTPFLIVSSPQKRCGKSLLLELLGLVVARPWRIDGPPTEAVLYRKVAQDQPTFLLDESDAIWNGNRERSEGLRGVLNSGNRRGATVPRCVGDGSRQEVVDFPVFCPRALAGIDATKWPDTIIDRGFTVEMSRKRRDENVRRYRRREVEARADELRRRLAQLAHEQVPTLRDARPGLPDELDDRAADAWEPLLAIADAAGGAWPDGARRAAVGLSGNRADDDQSEEVRLLSDIRCAFRGRSSVTTAGLLGALTEPEESPWGNYRPGRLSAALGPRDLAALLKPFGIGPKNLRHGESILKGYGRGLCRRLRTLSRLPPGILYTRDAATRSLICHKRRL